MSRAGQLAVAAPWRAWLLSETPRSRAQARLGQAYVSWLGFRRNGLAMAGLAVLIGLLLIALCAPLLTDRSPFAQDLSARLRPPNAQYWFGTDELGRDIYTRVLYGSRITLVIVGLVVVMVAPLWRSSVEGPPWPPPASSSGPRPATWGAGSTRS